MGKQFIVETSARHVHVTQQDLETLFGAGYQLTPKKYLSQPGQFASEERVDVVGPKKTLSRVSILGPVRPETQIELSLTDARSIGVNAPIRESGDLAGSDDLLNHDHRRAHSVDLLLFSICCCPFPDQLDVGDFLAVTNACHSDVSGLGDVSGDNYVAVDRVELCCETPATGQLSSEEG